MKQKIVLLLTLLAGLFPQLVAAQEPSSITRSQAVNIALEKNPQRKVALAVHHAALADVREARSGFFPRISFTESAFDGNDPVFAFGTRLRQGRFTGADFALNQLNHPTPIGDFSARFSGQWTVFDSFSSQLNLRRSRWMEQASQFDLDRAGQQTVYAVIDAYYSLLFATKQAELAEETRHTAESLLQQSQSRVDAGMTVEADALSAKVLLAERQQEVIRARNDVALAKARFNTVLGVDADSPVDLGEALSEHPLEVPELKTLEENAFKHRPDLLGVAALVAAQRTGVSSAKASFGPRLNLIGSWQSDSVNFAGDGGNNWVAGAELQIDLFTGGAKLAHLEHEKAMQERIEAIKNGAEENVRLELRRAYYGFDSARQSLDVARAAVSQSDEALRMMRDRYESGLATITDLLRTEDTTRRSRTNYWEAVCRYSTSYAAMELAAGTLSASSPVVTQ